MLPLKYREQIFYLVWGKNLLKKRFLEMWIAFNVEHFFLKHYFNKNLFFNYKKNLIKKNHI